jgi:hypothetical protein
MAGYTKQILMKLQRKRDFVNGKNALERKKAGLNEADYNDVTARQSAAIKEDRRRREDSQKKYYVDGIEVDAPEEEMGITVTAPVPSESKPQPEAKPQQQAPQQRRQQVPVKREKAPVIDFGRLAEKGYLSEQRSNNPGENMPNPMAKNEEPPVRRGKDLLYSKARERNTEELTEQAPIKEPVQETKAPNYDDMWANASDDDKAAFAEFMAQRNK